MGEIKRSDFISQQFTSLFKDKYRIRLFEATKVPIVGDLSIFKDKQIIVIDLPSNTKQCSKTVHIFIYLFIYSFICIHCLCIYLVIPTCCFFS
uniref:Uncharacterized protein n=1 Tax=Ascaris lumbricoides TaxID=6252 RepID=A0A0M3HIT6_ASCLU